MQITEALDELSFSYNWNGKLNCNTFTTIRLKNPNKFTEGKILKVYLNKVLFGFYRIESIKTITLAQINDWIGYLDTGYNAEGCRKIIRDIYKNKPNINTDTAEFYYILLSRTNGPADGNTHE